ncbi:MAG: ABC transporter permease [Myxococcales bacterium]|nr:ABC transporter permease [Myxococcales bacterium]MCB9646006.1 ABC transporter permease [Deltaproteobacteria bacterium]
MSGFITRLWALAKKEVLHMARDPQVILLALGMPLLLVVLFGYAVSFDVEDVPLAVVDQDHSPASRDFAARMDESDAFRIRFRLESEAEAEALFRADKVKAALVIPEGYARSLTRGEPTELQLLMDGADGTTARVAVGYASQMGQLETLRRVQDGLTMSMPLEPRVRTWFNPTMDSAVFVVPGLVAIILAVLSVLLAALTVAREWERGSMEQLFATPVDRLAVVLGKVLPYVALGILQFMLVLAAGAWLFDVPLRGRFVTVLLAVILFLTCSIGQGLLISMVTRNQQVATQVGAVSSILPALLLSGFLFPVENMPLILQVISRIVPARYLISVLRAVLLQGRSITDLGGPFLSLVLLAIALITLTTLKFRRRLD